jgi:hypothetical protein
MIDHYVSIGGEDVSADCYGIRITQTMTTDSDPGKATINLVNRRQKYTNHWPPQATDFQILFYNYSYKNEPKTFFGLNGHITDVKCTAAEAIVTGECGMGHLADALGKEYAFNVEHPPQPVMISDTYSDYEGPYGVSNGFGAKNTRDILVYIMSQHLPDPVAVSYTGPVREVSELTYDAETTYQYVVEDIAKIVGAVYYFNHENVLEFHAPEQWAGRYNLDGYMINPEQTSSIMGYCNIVQVVGNAAAANDTNEGAESASSETIIATARDSESIERFGELIAPKYTSYNIVTQADAQAKADELLQFYKLHKNALTKPIVAGMAPPLQSKVGFTPFVPINSEGAEEWGQVTGIVIEREIDYDADQGFICTLTLSPGLTEGGAPITDTAIEDYYLNYADEDDDD